MYRPRTKIKQFIYIAARGMEKTGAGEIHSVYGEAKEYEAAIFPVSDVVDARMNGFESQDRRMVILGAQAAVEARDGVWLTEDKINGKENANPPWIVVSVMRWHRHTELLMKRRSNRK